VSRADLSGVRVKIDRAKTHLNDFDAQAELIIEGCRRSIFQHPGVRNEHIFRFGKVPAVPSVMSAMIGDAIHNLRVSLDHLAWQLVTATGSNPGKNTSFPIHTTAPTPDRCGRTRPQISPDIPLPVREILDEVQPYKLAKPAHHDLAVLHELDIIDKHRELLIAIIGVKSISWFGMVETTRFNSGPYHDGDEICRFAYSGWKTDFWPVLALTVRLDEPAAGPWGLMLSAADLVRRSLNYVEDEVLPRFRGYIA
jgi:hypothetical protein